MPHKLLRWMIVVLLGLFFGMMIGSMILGWCAFVPAACA